MVASHWSSSRKHLFNFLPPKDRGESARIKQSPCYSRTNCPCSSCKIIWIRFFFLVFFLVLQFSAFNFKLAVMTDRKFKELVDPKRQTTVNKILELSQSWYDFVWWNIWLACMWRFDCSRTPCTNSRSRCRAYVYCICTLHKKRFTKSRFSFVLIVLQGLCQKRSLTPCIQLGLISFILSWW